MDREQNSHSSDHLDTPIFDELLASSRVYKAEYLIALKAANNIRPRSAARRAWSA